MAKLQPALAQAMAATVPPRCAAVFAPGVANCFRHLGPCCPGFALQAWQQWVGVTPVTAKLQPSQRSGVAASSLLLSALAGTEAFASEGSASS
mmetsp:Transcript_28820/g.67088  ORF Transcript_28820/g.67088 Transcript_28820/m.67088 type:complete len:93 (-) Transcript_28820:1331-1609(-)